ncbi:hypothetical protein [Streptomyces lavendulae]|uniref:hypothetical protein n=1 Tax=Streptomyces lavendulae TaxID=1914 RepID=UPI00381F8932
MFAFFPAARPDSPVKCEKILRFAPGRTHPTEFRFETVCMVCLEGDTIRLVIPIEGDTMHLFDRPPLGRPGTASVIPRSETPVYDSVVADLGYPAVDSVVPGQPEVTWEEHLGYLPR